MMLALHSTIFYSYTIPGRMWSCVVGSWRVAGSLPLGRSATHAAPAHAFAEIMPPVYPFDQELAARVRVFGRDGREVFGTFLTQVLTAKDAVEYVRDIDRAQVRPAEDLMRAVDQAVRSRSVFTLLDEQQETVVRVFNAVEEAQTENNKQVFIISGGPGTGKSVLALELLGRLSRRGSPSVHASGSTAFAETLRKYLIGRRGGVADVFTFFHQHRRRIPNQLNVLIADEAHRLRKNSNLQRTKAVDRSDVPQVHELIQAARVPVFLLDPYQVVRREEVGTPGVIRQAALDLGVAADNIHEITLEHQFRHRLCPDYVDWVEDLLGYGPGSPRPWEHQGDFQLLLAESPAQMEDYLRAQIALGHSARITAGYCWEWTQKPLGGGKLAADVRIGDWARPWNASRANRRLKIPSRQMWATNPAGFDQVGCIYTAQSFEWDYTGVIIGSDYTWRDDRWVSTRNEDRTIWGSELHEIVCNIYRVLATRGVQGVVLYSTDTATRSKLADLGIPPLAPALSDLHRHQKPLAATTPTCLPPIQGPLF
jgi:uncharacterized protein